ncbi:sensor histidine kinase [Rhodopirellula halodulae]|uniref:sensor histidine kinase n=1 Tax=Rhodopirellula halodulae TaxID=2894198 RepID=UPI001E54A53D|nr:HAMP domain-containing sensor histidine kinase [Rhodopirellula sp. JC737]MCC9655782.1 HAMP domain-containing histidine kinase [Rhodopirellula sp. JC737]
MSPSSPQSAADRTARPSRLHRRPPNHNHRSDSDPVGAAVRLISETAHDLKSPLAGIAATMEAIRDGSLGDVTPSQAEFLQAAMNQCQYIDTLVSELARAERLRSGSPRVRRVATKRSAIQEAVDLATRPVLSNHRIELLWGGTDANANDVMVDPNILSRLLINLIVNAQRASQEGSPILIRVEDNPARGVAVWSVIDRGRGMSPAKLKQLGRSGAIASDSGGEGLGLMIAQQMAALHFSSLTLRSRVGSGTDAVFETPLASPSAIATTFARYRSQLRGERSRPHSLRQWKEGQADSAQRELTDGQRIRIESLINRTSWNEVELHGGPTRPIRADRLSLVRVTADDECPMEMADRFDQALQYQLTTFELAYRTSRRSWVCAFDADDHSLPARMEQIDQLAQRSQPAMSLHWNTPAVVPIHERNLQCLLVDAMTTQSLSEAPGKIADMDSVRLGTPEISFSPVAAARLDEELRRLNHRMKSQSERLQQQSAAIRPQTRPS